MNAVMPTPLRIQYAGVRYHVMSRDDRREAIFRRRCRSGRVSKNVGQACLKTGWLGIKSATYVSDLLFSIGSRL